MGFAKGDRVGFFGETVPESGKAGDSQSQVEQESEKKSISGTGGVVFGEDSLEEVNLESPEFLPWGQLQVEILEALLLDEEDTNVVVFDGKNLESLAKRLRTSVAELVGIFELTDPQVYAAKRLERLLEAERIRGKDFNWDRLEVAVLGKLENMVKTNKVTKVGELLAVATAANRAVRKTTPGGGAVPNLSQTNIYMNGGGEQSASLPGPGGLGTMKLTLSPKTVAQLSKGITIEAEAQKFSDSVEMLQGGDVPELSKLADDS